MFAPPPCLIPYTPAKLGVGGGSFDSDSKWRDCLANEEATEERLELRDEAIEAGRGGGVGNFDVSANRVSSRLESSAWSALILLH